MEFIILSSWSCVSLSWPQLQEGKNYLNLHNLTIFQILWPYFLQIILFEG